MLAERIISRLIPAVRAARPPVEDVGRYFAGIADLRVSPAPEELNLKPEVLELATHIVTWEVLLPPRDGDDCIDLCLFRYRFVVDVSHWYFQVLVVIDQSLVSHPRLRFP